MKLQHLAIIFIIIILPISLVLGEYIQGQIDTINMQTSYSKRLQDATYDALKAFQINTVNNKYSSISDSKIRDIEASVNTFYNSLGTSMGASGYDVDTLKEYIPAMVYTMYDGYYIYGRYFNYEQTGNGGGYQYGLKPYIYYACRYKSGGSDFVINYTLDNSITVYGTINGKYVTRSGYVINPNLVSNYDDKGVDWGKLGSYNPNENNYSELHEEFYNSIRYPLSVTYDGVKIEREILKEQLVILGEDGAPEKGVPEEFEYTFYKNQKIYKDNTNNEFGNPKYFLYNKNQKQYLSDKGKQITTEQYLDPDLNLDDNKRIKTRGEVTPLMYAIQMTDGGHLYSNSGVEYYQDAKIFSTWLHTNLGNINQTHAIDSQGNKIEFSTNTGTANIFDFDEKNNPLVEGSTFNEHRMSVIRKSIETNLSSAIANFNTGSGLINEFQMPVFTEEDWEKLLNNVSLSVFMQGIPMKSKMFNSYCIITNDRNEEVVTEDSLYVIAENSSGTKEVHLPGCMELIDNKHNIIGVYSIVDFSLQTIGDNICFYYPQLGNKSSGLRTYCYNCIVNISETYNIDDIIKGKLTKYDTKTDDYLPISDPTNFKDVRKAYLTALGRTRYDLYRSNQNI